MMDVVGGTWSHAVHRRESPGTHCCQCAPQNARNGIVVRNSIFRAREFASAVRALHRGSSTISALHYFKLRPRPLNDLAPALTGRFRRNAGLRPGVRASQGACNSVSTATSENPVQSCSRSAAQWIFIPYSLTITSFPASSPPSLVL
jgi:hypothetical protein